MLDVKRQPVEIVPPGDTGVMGAGLGVHGGPLHDDVAEYVQRHRSFLETMSHGDVGVPFAILDSNSVLYYCNEPYESFLGYSWGELAGLRYYDIFGESFCIERREMIEDVIGHQSSRSCVGAICGAITRSVYAPPARADYVGDGLRDCVTSTFSWHPSPMLHELRADVGKESIARFHDFGIFNSLTHTELLIVARIARGMTNREIAQDLHRSIRTIEGHRQTLSAKIGSENVNHLLAKAFEAGLDVIPYEHLNISIRKSSTLLAVETRF